MKKIIIFSILLLSTVAVTIGTTITTTIQIQPAYSQAQTCRTDILGASLCVTPGQNPTLKGCLGTACKPPREITHQQAGQFIGDCHSTAAQSGERIECTVTPPQDQ